MPEVAWLMMNGFEEENEDDNRNLSLPEREMSLFENERVTNKLLRVMLTPRLTFIQTENELNCIYLKCHIQFLERLEELIVSLGCYGCAWMTRKYDGFSHLDIQYLNSEGATLNHLKKKKISFNFQKDILEKGTIEWQQYANQTRWYYKLIRTKRYYDESRFRKLNDIKEFVIWKWIRIWLPLAINEDLKNVFDLNRYLIKVVTNKYKVALDWKDVFINLGIHVCQLIPDTLKHVFNHKINSASPIFLTFLHIKEFSKDLWKYKHDGSLVGQIYTKIFRYPKCLLYNVWYREYLLEAIKLPNAEFEHFMKDNNLISAWKYGKKLEEGEIEEECQEYEDRIKQKWSQQKMNKVLEICEI